MPIPTKVDESRERFMQRDGCIVVDGRLTSDDNLATKLPDGRYEGLKNLEDAIRKAFHIRGSHHIDVENNGKLIDPRSVHVYFENTGRMYSHLRERFEIVEYTFGEKLARLFYGVPCIKFRAVIRVPDSLFHDQFRPLNDKLP
jgi:hypothetical protein